MLGRSPLSQATMMVGMRVNGTRYSRAGCAEFMTNREMKVAMRPRMYADNRETIEGRGMITLFYQLWL